MVIRLPAYSPPPDGESERHRFIIRGCRASGDCRDADDYTRRLFHYAGVAPRSSARARRLFSFVD